MATLRTSAKLREEIVWSGPCAYCGDCAPTQVDHVIPRSRGGTDDRDNLVPACKSCNMEKLDFTPEEWKEWRLAEGLGWPPKSRIEIFSDIVADLKARFPDVNLRDVARRMAQHALDSRSTP